MLTFCFRDVVDEYLLTFVLEMLWMNVDVFFLDMLWMNVDICFRDVVDEL